MIVNRDCPRPGIDGRYLVPYAYIHSLRDHLLGSADDEFTMVGDIASEKVGHAACSIGDERASLKDHDLQVSLRASGFGGGTHASGYATDDDQAFYHGSLQ
jgi:hypothetical protein